jgi:hypothetical protein
MKDVNIVFVQLVYFTAIWYILWPFGIFYGHLVPIFSGYLVYSYRFGMLQQEKSVNPDGNYGAHGSRER